MLTTLFYKNVLRAYELILKKKTQNNMAKQGAK